MNIEQLHINTKRIADNFDRLMIKVISQFEAETIDLNTGQLEKGIYRQGDEIEPRYAFDEYAKFKKSIGSKAKKGVPDLKLEGDFYEGFGIKYLSDAFEIDSKDEKANNLERKYSSDIYGLTKESINELQKLIKPVLINALRNELTR